MPRGDGAPRDGAPEGSLEALTRRRLAELSPQDDPDVARLLRAIAARHRNRLAAVLLYGSWLRGRRDTLLDFYVLLSDLGGLPPLEALGNRLLPPNVYYLSLPEGAGLRAKYATMTLGQFQRAMGDFHGYFWSRFTQPVALVYARDEETVRRVSHSLADAVRRFTREVVPVLTEPFSGADLWRRGLALTYASELRAEDTAGVASLYAQDASHFDALTAACAAGPGSAIEPAPGGGYRRRTRDAGDRSAARWRWPVRRALGKVLSVLRLLKAAGTFDDPLDYLLWKIRRHSGVYISPTERQRRHPLIFAWPLLWRLYRRGAFR